MELYNAFDNPDEFARLVLRSMPYFNSSVDRIKRRIDEYRARVDETKPLMWNGKFVSYQEIQTRISHCGFPERVKLFNEIDMEKSDINLALRLSLIDPALFALNEYWLDPKVRGVIPDDYTLTRRYLEKVRPEFLKDHSDVILRKKKRPKTHYTPDDDTKWKARIDEMQSEIDLLKVKEDVIKRKLQQLEDFGKTYDVDYVKPIVDTLRDEERLDADILVIRGKLYAYTYNLVTSTVEQKDLERRQALASQQEQMEKDFQAQVDNFKKELEQYTKLDLDVTYLETFKKIYYSMEREEAKYHRMRLINSIMDHYEYQRYPVATPSYSSICAQLKRFFKSVLHSSSVKRVD